jgi:hypothetical protein
MPILDATEHCNRNDLIQVLDWLKERDAYYGKYYTNKGSVLVYVLPELVIDFMLVWPDSFFLTVKEDQLVDMVNQYDFRELLQHLEREKSATRIAKRQSYKLVDLSTI